MRISTCAAALLGALNLTCAHGQQHIFDVRDDIALRRFNSPSPEATVPGSELAETSPDGRFVAIVTTRGILARDLVQTEILLFDLHQVAAYLHTPALSAPKPRLIASVESYPHHVEPDAFAPVIKGVQWSSDSTRLLFRKENPEGNYQLCTARVDVSGLECLTPPYQSVDQFTLVGETIVLTAGDPKVHLIDPGRTINADAVDVTGARIQEILFPNEVASHATALYHLSVLKLGSRRPSIRDVPKYRLLNMPILSATYPFKVSPNGKRLVDLEPVTEVPSSWTSYITAPGAQHLRLTEANDPRLLRADNPLRVLEYTFVDLKTGREVPLLGAPSARSLGYTADRNQAAWSPDGDHVVVTNTFVPISAEGGRQELLPCAAAVIDIATLKRRCLFFEDGKRQSDSPRIQDIAYGRHSDEIRILLRNSSGTETIRTYALQEGQWRIASSVLSSRAIASLEERLQPTLASAFVRQSLNDPPTLWARDRVGRERELWDPNPQLREMRFGEASSYGWRDDVGRSWSAILVKPVDYRPGVRYPLVIQLYNYRAGEFITDGLEPTAFAARELADAGFVVLQVRKQPDTVTEQDPEVHLEGYSSAIQRLSDDGLVDKTRVGVVGFSLTCWYAVNALIKKPELFQAATIADGIDNSYMQYMLFAGESYLLRRQMDRVRGSAPIGAAALRRWIDQAPAFNLDRVQTPVRIEAMGPSSVIQEWELYSSLRLQKKAVDLIYFPNGTHIHQLPLERLESQQGNVDWMRFWLQQEEDPDPRKRAQYQEWEMMRSANHRSVTESPSSQNE